MTSTIIIRYVIVEHLIHVLCIDGYAETVVISTFGDCDILDKATY